MKSSNLIINADDYGMGEHIDMAILSAIQNRFVDSVSVAVNHLTSSSAKLIKNHAQQIEIGLHLNLSEGSPLCLTKKDSLVGENGFHDALLNIKNEELHDPSRIQDEIKSQLDRFANHFNALPTHIDSHQHFCYLSPKAFLAFSQITHQFKLSMRSPLPFMDTSRLKLFIERIEKRLQQKVPIKADLVSKNLADISQTIPALWRTQDCKIDEDRELKALRMFHERPQKTLEIICHPR